MQESLGQFIYKIDRGKLEKSNRHKFKFKFLMCKYSIKKCLKKIWKNSEYNINCRSYWNLGQANYAASKAGIIGFSKKSSNRVR